MSEEKDYYVHPSSIVDDGVEIGADTKIWHFVHVSGGASLGERCVLGQNVFIGSGVKVGHGVKIQNNVSVYAGVDICDDAFLGPSCVFTNVINPRSHENRRDEFKITRVGVGASIGANATVVCGNQIGDYAFIGAGSVVTRDIAPHALVYGTPATQHGWMCRCGEKLPVGTNVQCERCGDEYKIDESKCVRVEGKS